MHSQMSVYKNMESSITRKIEHDSLIDQFTVVVIHDILPHSNPYSCLIMCESVSRGFPFVYNSYFVIQGSQISNNHEVVRNRCNSKILSKMGVFVTNGKSKKKKLLIR